MLHHHEYSEITMKYIQYLNYFNILFSAIPPTFSLCMCVTEYEKVPGYVHMNCSFTFHSYCDSLFLHLAFIYSEIPAVQHGMWKCFAWCSV